MSIVKYFVGFKFSTVTSQPLIFCLLICCKAMSNYVAQDILRFFFNFLRFICAYVYMCDLVTVCVHGCSCLWILKKCIRFFTPGAGIAGGCGNQTSSSGRTLFALNHRTIFLAPNSQFVFFSIFNFLCVYVCVCKCVHSPICHRHIYGGQRTFMGVGSLLPPHGLLGSNSGCQSW